MNGTRDALTVEQLNTYIRDYIGNSPLLRGVSVKGEISNLKTYQSGHIYFTLKDERSAIPATMFGGVGKLAFTPENGMKVICTGRVAVFVRDGQYRIYADTMEPFGAGSLFIAFEQLKAKLASEGLFDPAHKKTLPRMPFSLGIITAPGGAAVRDMINVSRRRFPGVRIYLYPSLVQGPSAPEQLINALSALNGSGLCDVIIIGRGGGSTEDLWCFNDESLARAVYSCKTPIISAVGHETDFTICDFVADLRAPTPSAAAELAIPDSAEKKRQFANLQRRMNGILESKTGLLRQKLAALSQRPVMKSPRAYFDERRMTVAHDEEKLFLAAEKAISKRRNALSARSERLSALDPLSVLRRGFSVAFGENGKAVRSVSELPEGTGFRLMLSDGTIAAQAKKKEE